MNITGPKIYFTIPVLGGINITDKLRETAREMLSGLPDCAK